LTKVCLSPVKYKRLYPGNTARGYHRARGESFEIRNSGVRAVIEGVIALKRLLFSRNGAKVFRSKGEGIMDPRSGFDREKLAELILYISQRCKESPTFGATLLNKILFYSDFLHYGRFGRPITGTTYVHRARGPAPEPHQFLSVRERLVEEGRLQVEETDFRGYTQKRTKALTAPKMEIFSETERDIIDRVIDTLKGHTATDITGYTHSEVPWLLTKEGEEIPYYTVFIRQCDPVPMEYLSKIQEAAMAKGIT